MNGAGGGSAMENDTRSNAVARRLKASLFGYGFAFAGRFLFQLLQVPLFLSFWSAAHFGEWVLLLAFPTYVLMLEAGLSIAASNVIAHKTQAGLTTSAAAVFQSYAALVGSAAPCLGVLLVVLVYGFDVANALPFARIKGSQLSLCLMLLVAFAAGGLLISVCVSGLRGTGLHAAEPVSNGSLAIGDTVAVALSLVLSGEAHIVLMALVLVRVCVFIGLGVSILRTRPQLLVLRQGLIFESIGDLLKPATGFALYPAANVLRMHGTDLIVGIAAGPVSLALYYSCRVFAQTLSGVCQAMSVLGSEASYLGLDAEKATLRLYHRRAFAVMALLSVTGAIGLWTLGTVLFDVWTQGQFAFPVLVLPSLIAAEAVLCLSWPSQFMVFGLNQHLRIAPIYLKTTVGYLAVAGALAVAGQPLFVLAAALFLANCIYARCALQEALRVSEDSSAQFKQTVFQAPFFAMQIREGWRLLTRRAGPA